MSCSLCIGRAVAFGGKRGQTGENSICAMRFLIRMGRERGPRLTQLQETGPRLPLSVSHVTPRVSPAVLDAV